MHLSYERFGRYSGVKQYTFRQLISSDIAKIEMVFNLIIHHSIMITCISYEITFTLSLPNWIDIPPL